MSWRDAPLVEEEVKPKWAAAPELSPESKASVADAKQRMDEQREFQENTDIRARIQSDPRTLAVHKRDPGVDYHSGIPQAGFRAEYGLADDDEEREAFLEKEVGAGNFGKDSYGAYYIKPDGLKKIGIESKYPVSVIPQRFDEYAVHDKSRVALPLALGVGAALTGGAALPAMGLAALGGGAGEAANTIIKGARGTQRASPLEVAGDIATEAAFSAGGEGAARGIMALGRAVRKGPSIFIPEERKEMTRELLAEGFRPTIQQAAGATTLKPLQRQQGLGFQIYGNSVEAFNAAKLMEKVRGLQASQSGAMAEGKVFEAATGSIPTEKIGTKVQSEVRTAISNVEKSIDDLGAKLDQEVNSQLASITNKMAPRGTPVGPQIVADLEKSAALFRGRATDLYGRADALFGTDRVIPSKNIGEAAAGLRAEYGRAIDDPNAAGIRRAIEYAEKLSEGGNLTAREAHIYRSNLMGAIQDSGLTGSEGNRVKKILIKSVDDAFDAAMAGAGDGVNALRKANRYYRMNVEKFKVPEVMRLTKEAEQTGRVDPEKALEFITTPGMTTKMNNVLKLLSPETKAQVGRQLWDSILKGTTQMDGSVSPASLYKKVLQYEPNLRVLHGDKTVADMIRVTKQYEAIGGKLEGQELKTLLTAPDQFANLLRQKIVAQESLDKFLKTNYLAHLASPGTEAKTAVDWIVRPQNSARIKEAEQFFGKKSPIMNQIREAAMQNLVGKIITPSADNIGFRFDGHAFSKTVNEYGKDTLESLYGKEVTDQMFKLARHSKFLTAPQTAVASLEAQAKVANWSVNKTFLGMTYIMRKMFGSEKFMRWFTLGLDEPTSAAGKLAIKSLNGAVRAMTYQPQYRTNPSDKSSIEQAVRRVPGVPAMTPEQMDELTGVE